MASIPTAHRRSSGNITLLEIIIIILLIIGGMISFVMTMSGPPSSGHDPDRFVCVYQQTAFAAQDLSNMITEGKSVAMQGRNNINNALIRIKGDTARVLIEEGQPGQWSLYEMKRSQLTQGLQSGLRGRANYGLTQLLRNYRPSYQGTLEQLYGILIERPLATHEIRDFRDICK